MADEPYQQPHTSLNGCPAVVYIAPVEDTGVPRWDEVKAASCEDLSRGGISIRLALPPATKQLIVVIGSSHGGWTHLRAELVSSTPKADGTFLVTCKFLERTSSTRVTAPRAASRIT